MINWTKTEQNKTTVDGEIINEVIPTSIEWGNVLNTPTTLSGYGITDAYTKVESDAAYSAVGHSHSFAQITSKPTTIAGYGITDAYTKSESDLAYAVLGHNHDGVYEPADADITKRNEIESISGAWTFSANPSFTNEGAPFNLTALSTWVQYLDADRLDGLQAAAFSLSGHDHDLVYSAIGHNHDLAYSAIGHNHSGVYEPVDTNITRRNLAESISGVWVFANGATFSKVVDFGRSTGQPFTVTGVDTTMVVNLDAQYLGGNLAAAFSLSGHDHSGVYEPADSNITKKNVAEVISSAWSFSATTPFNVEGAPFDLNALSTWVQFLDADKLDGNHASAFELAGHTHTFAELTAKPTTLSGYGITDAYTKLESDAAYAVLGHTHTEYPTRTVAENITGVWVFANGATFSKVVDFGRSTGTPFTITGTDTTKVVNLDADMVDGLHASEIGGAFTSLGGYTYLKTITDKVGIGIAAPLYRVHIVDNVNGNTIVGLSNTNIGVSAYAGIYATSAAGNAYLMTHGSGRTATRYGVTVASYAEVLTSAGNGLLIGTTLAKPIIFGTSNLRRMTILSGGEIGIGTTGSTSHKTYILGTTTGATLRLRQDGTGYIQDWYDGATQRAYLDQAGQFVSADYKSLSDERQKDKMTKVSNSSMLKKVVEISNLVRTYERLDQDGKVELGWGAQSLYKIAPEYVHKPENEDKDFWAVGYSKMVVPLYSAVSSLNDRLNKVEKKLGL